MAKKKEKRIKTEKENCKLLIIKEIILFLFFLSEEEINTNAYDRVERI